MKYSLQIIINLPRSKVIELFDNPENMKFWQPGLVSFINISGEPGKPGTKSKLLYKMNKREVEMIETITVVDFPKEFSGIYEAKGVWNEVKNYFHETGENQTQWISENVFKCTGFLKLMIRFMPNAFKKQSLKYMQDFKRFAEEYKD